ncbi:ABC transporter substrate-binding protein [Yinghuangia soli]|uniref:ABC transporter substrate-binding protein n=1 Tax=Yinghuangia soli TaxID=2908204 RepID=A0AA41U372_9ACTN|nr:ABC transporter substrate-binding protein [Yinghuangia soli]MCF2527789.1 ABC transporter substrate-binding protein [Yinghuangia soli]
MLGFSRPGSRGETGADPRQARQDGRVRQARQGTGAPGLLRRIRRSKAVLRAGVGLAVLALTATTAACSDESSTSGGESILRVTGAPTGPLIRNFNPYLTTSPVNLVGGSSMIHEPLFIPNTLKVGSYTPWLAKTWEFSADGKQLTLNLQSGVKWTDGQPFSAEDVAFTLNMLVKNPALNANGIVLTEAKAEGPDKVVISFPMPSFTQLPFIGITYIVPKHKWGSVADPGTFNDENPVGTGPFMLETWSAQGYFLKKNPNYWQVGKPKIDGLRYVTFNSNVSANLALSQGQLDWTGNFVNNIESDYVGKDPEHNKYWFPAIVPTFLSLNLTKPQWQNADVRKAISLALDRDELVRLAEQNQQPANKTPTGLVMPQHEPFLADKYKGVEIKQDVNQAKALMQKAGYTIGGDGYANGPDGKRLTLTLSTSSGFTDILTMYQVMTEQLKKIGIEVKVEPKATAEWIANLFVGNFDGSTFGPLAGAFTPFDVYQRTLAGYLTKPVGEPAFVNVVRWKDAETDKLLMQYAGTTDAALQKQALEGLQTIMAEQVPVIPLFNFVSWDEYTTKNFVGWPDKDNPYSVGSPIGPSSVLVATSLEPRQK